MEGTMDGPLEGPMESPLEGPMESPLEGPMESPLKGPLESPMEGPIGCQLLQTCCRLAADLLQMSVLQQVLNSVSSVS